MNIYQQGFRDDILNTIFKLTTKTWLKITGVSAIQYLITILFSIAFIAPVVASNIDMFDLSSNMDNPEDILAFYTDIFESMVNSPKIIAAILGLVVVFMFVYAWVMNLQIRLSDSQIKKDRADFVSELKQSFTQDVLRLLGAVVVIYLIMMVLLFIAFSVATISGLLTFLLIIGVIIVMNRLFLVFPALIIGGMTIGEAFAWSFQKITWGRSFKILGYGILAGLVLFVGALIIGLVSSVFMLIPGLGQIIQFGINVFMQGFMAALLIATMLGLYYRYADDITEELEDKITLDDLLVR